MSAGALSSARPLLVALALFAGSATDVDAQGQRRTVLTIAGLPQSATNPTANDFDAGSVAVGSSTISVDLTTNNGGGGFSPRVTTVRVRCTAACPFSGTLPVASLQWRRADLGVWNSLTGAFVTIESRTAAFNGANDPWSNTLFWRYLLTWTTRPPTADTEFRLDFELQVTAP